MVQHRSMTSRKAGTHGQRAKATRMRRARRRLPEERADVPWASPGASPASPARRSKGVAAWQAILVVEIVDHDGWETSVPPRAERGRVAPMGSFQRDEEEEERHLRSVREWVSAHPQNDGS